MSDLNIERPLQPPPGPLATEKEYTFTVSVQGFFCPPDMHLTTKGVDVDDAKAKAIVAAERAVRLVARLGFDWTLDLETAATLEAGPGDAGDEGDL